MENTITSEELKTWAELVVKYQMGDLAPTFSRAANTIQKLQSDNKALLEACEAFDEADASDDGTGEAIGRVVSAKVLIKKAIEQAKEGGVMWATGFQVAPSPPIVVVLTLGPYPSTRHSACWEVSFRTVGPFFIPAILTTWPGRWHSMKRHNPADGGGNLGETGNFRPGKGLGGRKVRSTPSQEGCIGPSQDEDSPVFVLGEEK